MTLPADQRMALAQRLREAREYLNLSQEEVAAVLQVTRPAVTNIESGTRKVEAVELDQLAKLYRTSIEYLLTGEREVPEGSEFFSRALKGLSPADLDEVARFAQFLKAGTATKKRAPK